MLLLPRPFLAIENITLSIRRNKGILKLTGDEVVLEQLVDPLWRHHQAPLPILKVLLALVAILAGLLDHRLDLVGMERV